MGKTESGIADVKTVAMKVECVLKVPFVAKLRRALPIGFWRWLKSLAVCDAVEQMVGHSASR
jgi:hypothetical protein